MRQRLLAVAIVLTGVLATASLASETITYSYDAKGRLIEVQRTGSVNNNVKSNYYYDRAHNRTRLLVTGSPTLPPP
jgi:YD repeat-containing protein